MNPLQLVQEFLSSEMRAYEQDYNKLGYYVQSQ